MEDDFAMKTEKEIKEFLKTVQNKKQFCINHLGNLSTDDIYELAIHHCDDLIAILKWVLNEE